MALDPSPIHPSSSLLRELCFDKKQGREREWAYQSSMIISTHKRVFQFNERFGLINKGGERALARCVHSKPPPPFHHPPPQLWTAPKTENFPSMGPCPANKAENACWQAVHGTLPLVQPARVLYRPAERESEREIELHEPTLWDDYIEIGKKYSYFSG